MDLLDSLQVVLRWAKDRRMLTGEAPRHFQGGVFEWEAAVRDAQLLLAFPFIGETDRPILRQVWSFRESMATALSVDLNAMSERDREHLAQRISDSQRHFDSLCQ